MAMHDGQGRLRLGVATTTVADDDASEDAMRTLITSSGMLLRGGRESTRSAAPAIPDNAYSLKYQITGKERELKDRDIQIPMAPLSVIQGGELQLLKR